jgi:hypothetical protein
MQTASSERSSCNLPFHGPNVSGIMQHGSSPDDLFALQFGYRASSDLTVAAATQAQRVDIATPGARGQRLGVVDIPLPARLFIS